MTRHSGLSGAAAVALFATALAAQAPPRPGDFAVHCGRLYTGDGKVMAPAWIVVQGGKIAAVQATPPSTELRLVDASHKVVMPGIVAADCDLSDAADADYNVTPDVMALDAFDFEQRQRDALQGGVTTAYLSPGRQRLISGQGAVVKLAGTDLVQRVVTESACLRINVGDGAVSAPRVFEPNPHPTSDDPLLPSRIQTPTARINVLSELRRLFGLGRQHDNVLPQLIGPGSAENQYDPSALDAVVAQRLPLRAAASQAQDLRRALLLQKELGCRLVLEDPYEIEAVATQAHAQGAMATFRVPVTPGQTTPGGEDHRDKQPQPRLDAPAKAAAAGIPLALAPARGTPLRDYLLSVAFAVRGGLDPALALRAVGVDAARVLGVEHQVGSIQPGMDADFLILSGEPLAVGTMVETTYVDGAVAYERAAETTLLAVRCGRILTGEGHAIDHGVLLAENGRIKAVGEDLTIPFGARVIDLPGAVMTPGFIDAFSHLGLAGDGTGVPPGAANQQLADAIAHDDPMFADALAAGVTTALVSGKDGGFVSGRIAAIKTGAVDHDGMVLRALAGQRLVFDGIGPEAQKPLTDLLERGKRYADAWTAYEKALADFKAGKLQKPPEPAPAPEPAKTEDPVSGTWEGTVSLQGRFEIKLQLDLKLEGTKVAGQIRMTMGSQEGRPQDIASGSFEAGHLKLEFRGPGGEATLAGTIQNDELTAKITLGQLGEQDFTARRTSKEPGAAAQPATPASTGGKDDGTPKKPNVDENLEPIRQALHKRIPLVIRTTRQPSIAAVLLVLRQADVPFVLQGADAALDDPTLFGDQHPGILLEPDMVKEQDGQLVDVASTFADRGDPVLFGTGQCAGARFLPVHAAYAVRYGMSPDDALLALTRNAALQFQLDDRIGSLRKGKDADFVVFSGNPFEPTSRVLLVVCNGRIAVDQTEAAK